MAVRAGDRLERIEIATAADLRTWLEANHARDESVWLVIPRKAAGGDRVAWSDIVDEALCFGWIDSLPRKLDATRTMLLLSPRKRGSAWSRINRDKVARLTADGRMRAPGLAVIEAAKADGSFDRLAAIDDLEPPPDLADAFVRDEAARAAFDRFAPSSRRAILEWIVQAKRPETRSARVARTVALAARGLRANHPEAKGVET